MSACAFTYRSSGPKNVYCIYIYICISVYMIKSAHIVYIYKLFSSMFTMVLSTSKGLFEKRQNWQSLTLWSQPRFAWTIHLLQASFKCESESKGKKHCLYRFGRWLCRIKTACTRNGSKMVRGGGWCGCKPSNNKRVGDRMGLRPLTFFVPKAGSRVQRPKTVN